MRSKLGATVLRVFKRLEPGELIVSGGTGGAETADVFRLAGLLDVMREEQAEFLDHAAGR
jgi:uncharacterized protein (DUF362 family)